MPKENVRIKTLEWLRDEVYGGSWETMLADLEDRFMRFKGVRGANRIRKRIQADMPIVRRMMKEESRG